MKNLSRSCWLGLLLGLFMFSANAQSLRIGYVNTDRIFKEANAAKAAQAKLEQEFSKRQKDLVDRIWAVLQESGLPADHLELEITEGLAMFNVEASIDVMERLNDLGVLFSIDDFGTGYSSLSYLKRFPIEKIKIHQSFVQRITSDPEDAAISSAIISLTHSMKRKAIAEGVETDAQREFLLSHHCDEIQGHHFSKPARADEIEHLLREMAQKHGT